MLNWLSKHKFQAHFTAFLWMIISSIGMIVAIGQAGDGFIWLLVAIFASANLLAIFVK